MKVNSQANRLCVQYCLFWCSKDLIEITKEKIIFTKARNAS